MVYKYQEKTIKELIEIINKLEEKTDEHYRREIGITYEDNGFEIEIVPIFLEVNGTYYFTKQNSKEYFHEVYRKCDIEYLDRVKFKKDLFLQLNNLLDDIIKDNKERKEFHDILNRELEILNKSL